MKREMTIVAAGLGSLLLPRAASAQYTADGSPQQRTYYVNESCEGCTISNSVAATAIDNAAAAWNSVFDSQGWGSGWMTSGFLDAQIQFRNDYANIPGFSVPSGGCGTEVGGSYTVCDPAVLEYSQEQLEMLFTHEMGHLFGLHNDPTQYDTVMSGNPVWTLSFTAVDEYCLHENWGMNFWES